MITLILAFHGLKDLTYYYPYNYYIYLHIKEVYSTIYNTIPCILNIANEINLYFSYIYCK